MGRTAAIREYMTANPYTIGRDRPLSAAHDTMRRTLVRHLPVLSGGKLVGVLSQRDLYLVETLRDVDPEKVTVEEAMTADVYTASVDDRLADVVLGMAQARIGCAVILDHDKTVGVFTTTDAMRVLADVLN